MPWVLLASNRPPFKPNFLYYSSYSFKVILTLKNPSTATQKTCGEGEGGAHLPRAWMEMLVGILQFTYNISPLKETSSKKTDLQARQMSSWISATLALVTDCFLWHWMKIKLEEPQKREAVISRFLPASFSYSVYPNPAKTIRTQPI